MKKYHSTAELIQAELSKYCPANTCIKTERRLPSFELRSQNGILTIAAPGEIELLYGIYDYAEQFGNCSFFFPGEPEFPREQPPPPGSGILRPARPPLMERRGFIVDSQSLADLPAIIDYMAKNKLNFLLLQSNDLSALSPELETAARIRGIKIADIRNTCGCSLSGANGGLTPAQSFRRCINHIIGEAGCPANSTCATQLKKWCNANIGKELNVFDTFSGGGDYLALPFIHFDELYREISWYQQNGISGIAVPFQFQNWNICGANFNLMARAARNGDKLDDIEFVFHQLFGEDAGMGRRFFAEIKDLQLSTGMCQIPAPEALLEGVTPEQLAELHLSARELLAAAPESKLRRELCLWCEYLVRFKDFYDNMQAGRADGGEQKRFRNWLSCHREFLVQLSNYDRFFSQT